VTRREVMAAGAVTLGAVGAGLLFSGSASAQSGDEVAVTDVVEVLRKGILEPDKAKLAQVTSEQLSYGHSGGRVETKEQFTAYEVASRRRIPAAGLRPLAAAVVILGWRTA
jgi:hypothetical protein